MQGNELRAKSVEVRGVDVFRTDSLAILKGLPKFEMLFLRRFLRIQPREPQNKVWGYKKTPSD
jgi:hypothetical protein